MLANLLLVGVLVCVVLVLWVFAPSKRNGYLILLVFLVPFVLCQYFLTGQRLRDMGLTGWLALLWLPVGIADNYVGGAATLAFILVLCVVPGTVGPNRYGPDPLAVL
ncbi:membrane protein [Mesorhizobium sp. LSHC412B00]|nr:membrane protein [Mesorhizobium sp. LSHC412B00]